MTTHHTFLFLVAMALSVVTARANDDVALGPNLCSTYRQRVIDARTALERGDHDTALRRLREAREAMRACGRTETTEEIGSTAG